MHTGNTDSDSSGGGGGGGGSFSGMNHYQQMFGGGGESIPDCVTQLLSSSNKVSVLTFGFSSIFQAVNFGDMLESVGLLKFLDLSSVLGGISIPHMPAPFGLGTGKKGMGGRG